MEPINICVQIHKNVTVSVNIHIPTDRVDVECKQGIRVNHGMKNHKETDPGYEIEDMTPDSDDYPDIQGSLAQNAFIMMLHCYQFLLTSKAEDIIAALNILEYTIDVINYVIDENYDYEMECQKEFILLDRYLEILNEHQIVDEKVVIILRKIRSKNMFANPIM